MEPSEQLSYERESLREPERALREILGDIGEAGVSHGRRGLQEGVLTGGRWCRDGRWFES